MPVPRPRSVRAEPHHAALRIRGGRTRRSAIRGLGTVSALVCACACSQSRIWRPDGKALHAESVRAMRILEHRRAHALLAHHRPQPRQRHIQPRGLRRLRRKQSQAAPCSAAPASARSVSATTAACGGCAANLQLQQLEQKFAVHRRHRRPDGARDASLRLPVPSQP